MKRYTLYSLMILIFSFLACRFLLFDLHGMKEMPLILFIISLFILGIFYFVNYKKASIFVSLGYIIGFVIGLLFQKNGVDLGGGATNNLWLIWIRVFFVIVFIAIVFEYLDRRRIK